MAVEEKIEVYKIVSKYDFGQISSNVFMNFGQGWHFGICNCMGHFVLQWYRRVTQSSQESSLFSGTDGTNPKRRRGQRKNDKLHSHIILLDLVGTKC